MQGSHFISRSPFSPPMTNVLRDLRKYLILHRPKIIPNSRQILRPDTISFLIKTPLPESDRNFTQLTTSWINECTVDLIHIHPAWDCNRELGIPQKGPHRRVRGIFTITNTMKHSSRNGGCPTDCAIRQNDRRYLAFQAIDRSWIWFSAWSREIPTHITKDVRDIDSILPQRFQQSASLGESLR